MTLCIVFEVEGKKSPLPSSYFMGDALTQDINNIIEKVLEFYRKHNCSVQTLMGRTVQELTQKAVVPVDDLFKLPFVV